MGGSLLIEFRQDGQFLVRELSPLERLILKAVYSALEQGALPTAPLAADMDMEGKSVYVLRADETQAMLASLTTAVLQKAREAAEQDAINEAQAKKTEPRRGKYRVESRPCVRCGQMTLLRVVRETVQCPACGACSPFAREAGQKSAQLLCEQCAHVFTQPFDTSRDHRARYVSTVAREIDERSRFAEKKNAQEREKELGGDGKTWTFPNKMPPPDNGEREIE